MRSFTPFGDPWKLDIEVPYSLLVRDGTLGWTCGQVPLNDASEVLAPHDLPGQMAVVCDHIEAILAKDGISPDAVGKLVLYYVQRAPDDARRMMALCRDRFGERVVLVPVAVPHFYYEGLLLEVDAFAGPVGIPGGAPAASPAGGGWLERAEAGAWVRIVDAGELAWAAVSFDPARLADGIALLGSALADFGLDPDRRLSEHWFAQPAGLDAAAAALRQANLISDPGSLVESADPAAPVVGEVTYVRRPLEPVLETVADAGDVRIVSRRSGRFAWFGMRSRDAGLGLVAQTTNMMAVLAETLRAGGMGFGSVVKSTSHYVGGSTADELYENMMVRNGYYDRPGPASTGLPVAGLADRKSRIAVDVLALAHSADPDGGR